MAWAAACCKGEEASLCCCKGNLKKMSDSRSQQSKQWLILGLNSQVKVWYNTHPRRKQICSGNTDPAWSLRAFRILAISRLLPLFSSYLLPADVFQQLPNSLSFTYKTSTTTEQLKLFGKPNTEELDLLKSQSHAGKGEKLNIVWSLLNIACRREKSLG